MKKLYLIRHAESDKDIPGIGDRQRPLNKRGRREAQYIGKLLRKYGISIEAFYSSPAKRAIETAVLVAEEIGFPRNKIKVVYAIYGSNIPKLMWVIKKIINTSDSAAIFGHNPEFLNLVNYLTPRAIEKFSTCGVFGIGFKIDSWGQVSRKKGKIVFSERPKRFD